MTVNYAFEDATSTMLNYNQHSSYQSTTNLQANLVLTKYAQLLSHWSPQELNIGDFGCSHGLNSMECIKAALDGYQHQIALTVQVILNDLPENDFTQVSRCLMDPKLSYEFHPLFHHKDNFVTSLMMGRTFYKPCLPKNQLHLAISFNSLHWLPESIVLSKSFVLKSSNVTPDEQSVITEKTHQSLVAFLTHRANELKSGGYLVMTILQEMSAMELFNSQWKKFITKKGFTYQQLKLVTMPAYPRSRHEVTLALNQVTKKFNLIQFDSDLTGKGDFSILALKATTYPTLLKGLIMSHQFKDASVAQSFLDEFYKNLSEHWVAPKPSSHLLVLKKI